MIEAVLLIALGFCSASLLALLIAPSMWRRAVRLTTKRVESTMPMSLADIEADKDQLRADHAMQLRRLEAALAQAKDRSAAQLVEISRLQVVIGTLREEAAKRDSELTERQNAASVLEVTIQRRLPELEAEVTRLRGALENRSREIADYEQRLRRREESTEATLRAARAQQQELATLRAALEKSGAEYGDRLKRRPSGWSLEEYRAEYDRLTVELSRLREQLVQAQERDSHQTATLRAEMQRLAEQLVGPDRTAAASAPLAPAQAAPSREPIRPRPAAPETYRPAQSLRSRAREARADESRPAITTPVLGAEPAAPAAHEAPASADPAGPIAGLPALGADSGKTEAPPPAAPVPLAQDATPVAAEPGDVITDLVRYLQERGQSGTDTPRPIEDAEPADEADTAAASTEPQAADAFGEPREDRKRRLLDRLRTMNESASG